MISAFLLVSHMAFAAPVSLEGTYIHSCFTVGEDTLETTVKIQKGELVKTQVAYEDAVCKSAYLIYETRQTSATLSSAQALGQNFNVDLIGKEASYTSLTDEVSEALNMVGYCGFKDWQTGQKKIVTGLLCDEFQPPKLKEISFSILRLQADSTGALGLFVGAPQGAADGKTAQARHSFFEASPYLKTK